MAIIEDTGFLVCALDEVHYWQWITVGLFEDIDLVDNFDTKFSYEHLKKYIYTYCIHLMKFMSLSKYMFTKKL